MASSERGAIDDHLDTEYLVARMVADAHRARILLTELPDLSTAEQLNRLHSFVFNLSLGNSEAERQYRLLYQREPYSSQATSPVPQDLLDLLAGGK